MTRPEDLFEAASYDLNQFRERRMADRRAVARDTPDRRKQPSAATPVPTEAQSKTDTSKKAD